MEKELLFEFKEAVPRVFGMAPVQPINWRVNKGEQWCIIGPNGSGKSFLADYVAGKYATKAGSIDYGFKGKFYPTDRIKKVCFESAYLLADYKNMYYQQRFNALENETTPTVAEMLSKHETEKEYMEMLFQKLNITPLLEKRLIMLSSGELRRVLIVLFLSQRPELIIFDNPFIGLDAKMRKELDDFFVELSAIQSMLFVVPAINEIPTATTHILKADKMVYEATGSPALFAEKYREWLAPNTQEAPKVLPESVNKESREYEYVLRMKNINLSHQGHDVFKDLNWDIKRGEKWALLGPNGAGKSTLLSLLAADNPNAYSQDITIFDRKRGTGESIWDIKRPIGYISSEMHLYFQENQSCEKIVASGLFDTVGLFRTCSEEQLEHARMWMRLLGISHLQDQPYMKISSGEQRMVLLTRTLVKNPDLLILDEPLHGLDMQHKAWARNVIERFCEQPKKSLIYVTHRREEIPSCIDKVFELKKL